MSLLIDALRKAEANRQQGNSAATTAAEVAEALTLAPIDLDSATLPPAQTPPRATPASSQIESPPPRHALPSASATAAADEAARRNARQLFGSKPRQRVSPTWWVAGAGLVAAGLGAGYVWMQTQPRSLAMPNIGNRPAVAAPLALDDATAAGPAAQADNSTRLTPPPQAAAPVPGIEAPRRPTRRSTPISEADNQDAEGAIKLRTGAGTQRSPAATAIDLAYAAYERGDLPLARAAYEDALRSDPRASDAINGLAATALRQGRAAEAEQLFSRALKNNPQDPVARAGLLALGRETDPLAAESRLKLAAGEQPDVASNHFALGNLQAAGGRWHDAQQAYFKAVTLEPDNPDFLFNLAVALDRINQPKLARQYYERALQAANNRPAAFNRDAALRRAQSLTPQ
ncbi:tetratricopeptide repeat protein [Niveibacterium sp. 24ML]|uniref:tetratricopeptide repeat protein n=1 Tax=Niveibacterium sp. 24ML TaxID=2985512 RepID=UPI00226F0A30|nr:tetratricopeptide repeat protein [Niveibacterium sp. 24ML]MCX9154843.1 tetratricopeptide repeat protein [Niveibacterium sp. 24ML]